MYLSRGAPFVAILSGVSRRVLSSCADASAIVLTRVLEAKTHFERLEIPVSFDVELSQLDATFKRLQRAVHPDFFGAAPESLQESAARASSAINIAYKTIREPAARAAYLLVLAGVESTGETAGTGGASPALLAQVMSAREMIADETTPAAELAALASKGRTAVLACEADLSDAFRARDLQKARDVTVALSYYERIVQEADAAIEERARSE